MSNQGRRQGNRLGKMTTRAVAGAYASENAADAAYR